MEAKFFVESFGPNWFGLVKIENLPSLVGIVVFVSISIVNNNSCTFVIL